MLDVILLLGIQRKQSFCFQGHSKDRKGPGGQGAVLGWSRQTSIRELPGTHIMRRMILKK